MMLDNTRQMHTPTRRLPLAALLIAAVAAGAAACTTPTQPEKPLSDPSVPIHVRAGEEFGLRLESNMTTGFGWQLAQPLDATLLVSLGSSYEAPQTDLLGAPGAEVLRFRALASGETTIQLAYVQSWAPDASAAEPVEFDVIVE